MKLLIAEDEAISRVMLQRVLSRRGFEVVVAENGVEALELLQRDDAPMLAILDWMMPGLEGIEVCRKVRESSKGAFTYIIMLSARAEKQDFAAGMQAGADDYVIKPFDVEELLLRVRAGERIVKLQARLLAEARTDTLTGIFNRGAIVDILGRELAHATRSRTPLAVILGDLDNFKLVNDTHGHPIGDTVLRHVSQLLQAPLRTYDALGRYGGEEFLIVLTECGTTQALEIAERLRETVAGEPVSTSAGPVPMTMSFGVASHGKLTLAKELIFDADEALYRAKNRGRNRVEGPLQQ